MSVTSHHPGDLVETAPQLPPLQDAITEEEHQQQLNEEQRQVRCTSSMGTARQQIADVLACKADAQVKEQ